MIPAESDRPRPDSTVPSFDEAIGNAARLLREAELESDLHRMERLDEIAATWTTVAGLIHEHSRL